MNTKNPDAIDSMDKSATCPVPGKGAGRSSRRFRIKYILLTLRRDPLQYIAFFAAAAMIYISILFIQFGNELNKKTPELPVKASGTFNGHK